MSDSYIALVEKSIDERTQQYQELLQLRDENKKLRLENDKLREALKPFTLLLETDDETHSRIVGSPLLSDLHCARALLDGEN